MTQDEQVDKHKDLQPIEKENAVVDDPQLEAVLRRLDPDAQRVITAHISQSFSGPIPHPDILSGYETVKEGLAERIVRMAEKEQEARHRYQITVIEGPINATSRGQWMGFIIAILFLGASIFLAVKGLVWLAAVISSGTLVGLVTVFVTQKPAKSSNDSYD